jgi:hypothetical protein
MIPLHLSAIAAMDLLPVLKIAQLMLLVFIGTLVILLHRILIPPAIFIGDVGLI